MTQTIAAAPTRLPTTMPAMAPDERAGLLALLEDGAGAGAGVATSLPGPLPPTDPRLALAEATGAAAEPEAATLALITEVAKLEAAAAPDAPGSLLKRSFWPL